MSFNAKEVKEKIEKWIKKTVGDCTVVIGISGGIDSSVSAALCVGALGKDKVFGVLLPDGEQHDINMFYKLCEYLGIDYKVINIAEEVKIARENTRTLRNGKYKYFNLDAIPAEGKLFDYSETNTPSRIRMQKLYDVAAELNGCGYPSRVCNNDNLSEIHSGYSTKFGDGAGDFAPLADLTKTEVRALGREIPLPQEFNVKDAIDGMSKKILSDGTVHYITDEEKLGYPYDELDRYIRTGEIENLEHKAIIDRRYKMNRHKVEPMPKFESHLPIEAEKGYARHQELKPYIERLGIKEQDLTESYDEYIASCAEVIYDADGDYRAKWEKQINVYTSENTLVSIFKQIETETGCEITKVWLEDDDPLYDSDGDFQGCNVYFLELNNGKDYILQFDDPDDCK